MAGVNFAKASVAPHTAPQNPMTPLSGDGTAPFQPSMILQSREVV